MLIFCRHVENLIYSEHNVRLSCKFHHWHVYNEVNPWLVSNWDCEIEVDECLSDAWANGSTCVDLHIPFPACVRMDFRVGTPANQNYDNQMLIWGGSNSLFLEDTIHLIHMHINFFQENIWTYNTCLDYLTTSSHHHRNRYI